MCDVTNGRRHQRVDDAISAGQEQPSDDNTVMRAAGTSGALLVGSVCRRSARLRKDAAARRVRRAHVEGGRLVETERTLDLTD